MANIVLLDQAVISTNSLAGAACAFGVFDGFHRGHQFLIEQTIMDARRNDAQSTIATFDIDPDELFAHDKLVKLSRNEERIKTLSRSGVDNVVVFHFTKDFAALSSEDFLERAFAPSTPASVHVGSDFRFGFKAAGDLSVLKTWGDRHGMRVIGHDLEYDMGKPITATRIRELLATGSGLREANELLGHPYRMGGRVEGGRHEGREFGFRTANVAVEKNLHALAQGVYAAYTTIDGNWYKAAVSVGVSPTFADRTNAYCEAHILDFNGDLYDRTITLDFIEYLQPMRKFESKEELIDTVMGYITWVRNNL